MNQHIYSIANYLVHHFVDKSELTAVKLVNREGEIEQSLNYYDLQYNVSAIIGKLSEIVPAQKAILIASTGGVDFTQMLLGCIGSRAIAVPLDYSDINNMDAFVVQVIKVQLATRAEFAICNEDQIDEFRERMPHIKWLSMQKLVSYENYQLPQAKANDVSLIVFEREGQDFSKSLTLTNHNLVSNMQRFQETTQTHSRDVLERIVTFLPQFDISSIYTRLLPIMVGTCSIVMQSTPVQKRPNSWLLAMKNSHGTCCVIPSNAYEMCASQELECMDWDLSGWKIAIADGKSSNLQSLKKLMTKLSPLGLSANIWLINDELVVTEQFA